VRPIAASEDAPRPKGGPPFLRLTSWPYRAEMAAATLAILALFVWRGLYVGDLDVAATVFWFLWPDLAAFVPIGAAMARGRAWPSWGSRLYNAFHTFLVWGPVFLIWSYVAGGMVWPLLGWAMHITMDRTVGYYLRAQMEGAVSRK